MTHIQAKDLKVGDFITSAYKFGIVNGYVIAIKSRIAVIQRYDKWYDTFTKTAAVQNVTISRISRVIENPIIK